MKRTFIISILLLCFVGIFAQSNPSIPPKYDGNPNARYQLYPTQNMWTFIKLDTQTGKMWQVQFAINKPNERYGYCINREELLALSDTLVNGRFTLYPTENMYNFILLDQINGKAWQVQWSNDNNSTRGIVAEIKDY